MRTTERKDETSKELYVAGQLQHAHEHGGDELGMGDPVLSMRRRHSSGSKCSITTTVPPMRCTVIDQTRGAEW